MKYRIIYLIIAAAALVIGGVLLFYLFSSDSDLHHFNKRPAAQKEKPVNVMGPDADNSRKKFDTTVGNVNRLEENLGIPEKEKPVQTHSGIQSETAKDEKESEFEIDVYELKELFPDNLAVPSVTDEERQAKIKAREARNRAYGLIAANKASEEQIQAYYEQQSRLAEDSIEIIEFILDKYGEQLGERERAKQEFLLIQFQKRLDIIPKRKQEALERLK
ncbi:MAG: hypothetical protein PVI71_12475 [Desulfobacterales bacterium]|jgi:hypothetical protein